MQSSVQKIECSDERKIVLERRGAARTKVRHNPYEPLTHSEFVEPADGCIGVLVRGLQSRLDLECHGFMATVTALVEARVAILISPQSAQPYGRRRA